MRMSDYTTFEWVFFKTIFWFYLLLYLLILIPKIRIYNVLFKINHVNVLLSLFGAKQLIMMGTPPVGDHTVSCFTPREILISLLVFIYYDCFWCLFVGKIKIKKNYNSIYFYNGIQRIYQYAPKIQVFQKPSTFFLL